MKENDMFKLPLKHFFKPSLVVAKENIVNIHFQELLKILRISEKAKNNENLQDGLKFLLVALKKSKFGNSLSVYSLSKGVKTIGFGYAPYKTLFQIRIKEKSYSFRLNGKDIEHEEKWNKIAEEHHFDILFQSSIPLVDLSRGNKDTQKMLTKYLTLVEKLDFAESFLENNSLSIKQNKTQDEDDHEDEDDYEQDDAVQVLRSQQRSPKLQKQLRNKAIKKFDGKCVITNCPIAQCLEAAHIYDYALVLKDANEESQVSKIPKEAYDKHNVLLLSRDFHALFDIQRPLIHLIPIRKGSTKVRVLFDVKKGDRAKFMTIGITEEMLKGVEIDLQSEKSIEYVIRRNSFLANKK
ncbi:HNH endonuclease signature motif containing protein [Shewanella putrefaciens]|uniref:HNH endonuclease n=1 Tax=Shewanella putrefaciens TaxID=24 RepID=A0ABX8X9V2_SHEPU|nr:HNH endonuclease signature motif containing protein [Shewanella putrefaciens]MCT8942944.1 HNH endonuclease [Shewanella putrefaciens]QSE48816.1 HNH endonuclease [Shewanella putrefaciens]QYX72223.1 HNH endonuclease [Shewanella putrefaciens]GGN09859.1 hypothetical protein GCM10007984_04230 [Shewanella putrefaciens]